MAKITQLPKATAVTDSDIAVIVQDGETRQIPRTLLAPSVTVDAEMSETSENPVQNKAVTAAIQELETGVNDAFRDQADVLGQMIAKTPTDLKLENNQLRLIAGNAAIGNGVQIKKTPTLLDTFTVAEGEEPVLFFEKKLTGQNWRHVWINGEIYSSDTAASQTFHLRTGAGTEIFRQAFKYWDRGKAYVSAEMRRMPNGRIVGEIALSLHQYTNELGVYGKSVGRFNAEYINGVHISLDNQTQMFAAGTQIEVWGME